MKRLLITLALVVGMAVMTMAQTIHNHPQLAAYDAQHPAKTVSNQCHYESPDFAGPVHTHLDAVGDPIYSVESNSFTQRFLITLFHVSGSVTSPYGSRLTNLVWDATGTSTPPPLVGNPTGIVTFGLTATYALDDLITVWPHGGYNMSVNLDTYYSNHSKMTNTLSSPFFSAADPTVPEAPSHANGREVSSRCLLVSSLSGSWEQALIEVDDFLPLAPFNTPWTVSVLPYNYPINWTRPLGTFEQRLDPDLHNGIPGTILQTFQRNGGDGSPVPVVFDPTVISPGVDHKMWLSWRQERGPEAVTAILVTRVETGVTIPPAQVTVPNVVGTQFTQALSLLNALGFNVVHRASVNDPAPVDQVIFQAPAAGIVVNVGSTINLNTSLGPAAPQWEDFTPFFQRLVVPGQPTKYRICEAPGVCKEIM